MNALEIINKFDLFSDGIRIQMLIDRSNSNTNKGSRRWINKFISTTKEEFLSNVEKLLDLQIHIGDRDVRLYSSLNERKLEKSIKYFMHKQIDLNTQNEKLNFYKCINDRFCSALMKPENRKTKFFLIDYDSCQEYIIEKELNKIDVNVIKKYKTPNGFHYIVDPFNPLLLNLDNCEIKKDALILLNVI